MNESEPTRPVKPADPEATRALGAEGEAGPSTDLPLRVGRYRPLRVLGRGGMGVVYEAEQEEPRRRVALKVTRSEMVSDDLRRRFAHESAFLGRLQHPGIAQIYEAGTADTPSGPLPFMAMELVDGVPLNVWARDQKPDLRTRLELMIRLCEAVQHAHQRGIIHRDLKPGNVLVDQAGRPKVLDFGVARPAQADFMSTLLTTHGQLVGTLAYMSPEQLAGDPEDLDTRSDIFALGVILYQLLAGKPPLELVGRPLEEALKAIREEDPPPLSDADSRLAGDLTIIAATAMAKDRDQRYPSANGLAMDLRRYLNDEPIAARPPGTLYLVRKFARRHRPLVIGAVGVALALVLGIAASTWQAVRATRAEGLAQERLEQAESVTGFLQDMLASVQPEEARGREVTVHEVLDRAARGLDQGSLAGRPLVESALRSTLGSTFRSLGQLEESERNLNRGLTLADSLLPAGSPERLGLTMNLAQTRYNRGNHSETENLVGQVLPLAPAGGKLQRDALGLLADVRYTEGRWQEADSLQARVQDLALAEIRSATAAGQAPDSTALAAVLLDRAFLAEQQNDLPRASALADRAAAIYRQSYGEADPRMIIVRNKQGDIAKKNGRYPDALGFYQQSLAVADSIYDPEHPQRADVLWRRGDVLRLAGDREAGQADFLQALEIRRRVLGPRHRDIALALTSLGNVEKDLGNFDAAERNLAEALAMRREIFGPVHPAVVASLQDLGHLERMRKNPDQAFAYYFEAQGLLDQLPEATGNLAADNSFHIAMTYQGLGRHAEAEPYFRQELEIAQATHTSPHAKIAGGLGDLGACLFRQGRKSEAADLLVRALDMYRELGVQGGGLLQAIGNAAFILDDAGRFEEAAALHREYIALAGETYPPRSPNQSDARARYLDNLVKQGRWEQAEEQARLVWAWRQENLPADNPQRPSAAAMLAQTLVGQGRTAEAEAILAGAEKELVGMEQVPAAITARVVRVRDELLGALAPR